ncbi:MAG: TIGR04283 family arsenosugar biosynthesis glycosyltransferase [Oleiphilaceae bacterium]|nr:TIGR04283 family arsenosugar biosynthesis glycosyltransferase [Oleiphilaceae bacterium]
MKISVIVPLLNEADGIATTLGPLQAWRIAGHEVILADGGSRDASREAARGLYDRWLDAPRGRARQMNAGAALARGDVLLFLHADTVLPADALAQLQAFAASDSLWGRFNVRLSGGGALFRLIGFLINWRSRLTGIATGDQGIFVRADLFHRLGGFADIPLMEDVELCRRLRALGRPRCIRARALTSSRRWREHGPWRTIFLMWRLRWEYWRGRPPEQLVARYDRTSVPASSRRSGAQQGVDRDS